MKKISEINRHEIWPAVIAAGGALAGGVIAGRAAGQAADYQKDAAKIAAKLQREMYYQGRKDVAPWREAGAASVNQLRRMLGMDYYADKDELADQAIPAAGPAGGGQTEMQRVPIYKTKKVRNPNYEPGDWDTGKSRIITKRVISGYKYVPVPKKTTGTAGTGAPADMQLVRGTGEGPPGYEPVPEFEESPGYQFTLKEGERAIQNALSRMGMSRSGKHLRAATAHAEGLASTEYDNFLNRWYRGQAEKRQAFSSQINPYLAMAGMGQTSAQQTANLASTAGSQMGQAAMDGGEAQAGGAINRANALTGAISGGANTLLYYNALRNLQLPAIATPNYSSYQPTAAWRGPGMANVSGSPVDQWQYARA